METIRSPKRRFELELHGTTSQKASIITIELRRFYRMASSAILRRVALIRTDVSEERSASFIRVTRIGELGTTLAVTSLCGISSQRPSVASYS
jgi:hypothetical protein